LSKAKYTTTTNNGVANYFKIIIISLDVPKNPYIRKNKM
jgi:hypothetical protein